MMATDYQDIRWMKSALGAARTSLGRSGPNPAVGCALVSRDNRLLGIGATARGGRPHAETSALTNINRANVDPEAIKGGTAYVTLEPCAHHGETGPCADALIAAGVARVVIGISDPDPRVNGGGIDRLRAAGIDVTVGLLGDEARAIIAGFLARTTTGKPYVTVKTATSMDGMIALGDRKQRWLTGPAMRNYVHLERSYADGILTGIGTILADDPSLTCRNAGLEADSPRRFVMDSQLRCPVDAALFANGDPVTLFCTDDAPAQNEAALTARGAIVIRLKASHDGHVDIDAMLAAVAATGCNNLMVEAGTGLVTSMIMAGAVDRIIWTQSNHIVGSDGIAAIGPRNALELPDDMHYMHGTTIGPDRVSVFTKTISSGAKTL